jgi:hypothetical protein
MISLKWGNRNKMRNNSIQHSELLVSGLSPSLLITRKHNVSELLSVSETLFSSILNLRRQTKSRNPVILSTVHHYQSPLDYT